MTPAQIAELIAHAKKAATCIHIAAESSVADDIDKTITDLIAHIERNQRVIEALGQFVGEIICRDDGNLYDIDGGDIQDMAVKCGLFAPVEATESCATETNRCVCAEDGDFPMTCYRLTDIGKLALAEFDKAKQSLTDK